MLQKKEEGIRTKFTIPSFKIFPEIEKYNSLLKKNPTNNVAIKEGGFRTEFTIPSSKIFPEKENYNSYLKICPTKNVSKKREDFLQNSPFLLPKYFQR